MIGTQKSFPLCIVLLLCLYIAPLGWADPFDPGPQGTPIGTSPDSAANNKMDATAGNVTLNYIYEADYRNTDGTIDPVAPIHNLLPGNEPIDPIPFDLAVGRYLEWNDDGKAIPNGSLSDPSPNIGQYEDGILNGQMAELKGPEHTPVRILTGLEFVGPGGVDGYDLQDVDKNGLDNDPGWIHLAGYDEEKDEVTYDTVENPTGDLELSTLLTFNIDWTSPYNNPTYGGWELALDRAVMADLVGQGDSGMFDRLAISLKSSTSFAVYYIDLSKIIDSADALNYATAYVLGGTFNLNDFPNKEINPTAVQGLSHFNIWARDPSPRDLVVPEPATMLLMGFGLLGLAGIGRRKKE